MKITYGNYVLDIKVKRIGSENSFNDTDAGYFLNQVSIMAEDAAIIAKIRNHNAIANEYKTHSDEIYSQLKAAGFYEEAAEC